jgi:hypothetical protein
MIRMFQRTLSAAALASTLLVAFPAAAQLPRIDTTFASFGQMALPWTRSNLDRDAIAPGPGNQIFLASEEPDSIRLLKLDSRGVPVSDYVGGGIARVELDLPPFDLASVAPQPDGSVLLGGRRGVMRVDPAGRLDRTFGDRGRISVPYLSSGDCVTARVRAIFPHAGGWLIVATNFYIDTDIPLLPRERACTFVARLDADGQPDLAFGTNSNLVRDRLHAFDVVMKDGYLEILGRYTETRAAVIERIGLDGRMVESFGAFGTLTLPDAGAPSRLADGRILPDGSIVLVGGSNFATAFTVYRYKADRSVDFTFAGLGRSVITIRNQDPTYFFFRFLQVLPVADGGFLVRARVTESSPSLSYNEDLYKIDARGLPDERFGESGYARHRQKGDSRILAWMVQPDGYAVYSAAVFTGPPHGPPDYGTVTPFLTRVQAVPDLVEFHNRNLNHYFIAYDGLEAALIDGGGAGPGWERTGETFRPGGPTAVCRFYNPGANTHFFTIEPGECETVRNSAGWIFEGLGFFGTRLVNGACPANLRTVHRLFNNRQAFNDSNHRFVVDLLLVPAMVEQGWSLEGPVFCVKP